MDAVGKPLLLPEKAVHRLPQALGTNSWKLRRQMVFSKRNDMSIPSVTGDDDEPKIFESEVNRADSLITKW